MTKERWNLFEDCYRMQAADMHRFAKTLADGFAGYPLYEYVCGAAYDHQKMELFWLISIALSHPNALCLADSPQAHSVIIYLPPRTVQPSLLAYLLNGGLRLLWRLGLRSSIRLLRFNAYAEQIATKYKTENDGYILAFATHREQQGRHHGKRLLSALLRHLDAQGEGCYIETLKMKNVGFYTHFGFELKEQSTTPKGKLPFFAMLRPPQQQTK